MSPPANPQDDWEWWYFAGRLRDTRSHGRELSAFCTCFEESLRHIAGDFQRFGNGSVFGTVALCLLVQSIDASRDIAKKIGVSDRAAEITQSSPITQRNKEVEATATEAVGKRSSWRRQQLLDKCANYLETTYTTEQKLRNDCISG